MSLKILADTRQIVSRLHAHFSELARRAYAREQQQLGRIDRPARKDHFAVGTRFLFNAIANVSNSQSSPSFDQQSRNVRAGQNGEIFAMKGRLQIRVSRAVSYAVFCLE